jgi:GNAT superfamily N-acetyltransferase
MNEFGILEGVGSARNLIYATWLRSYEASSLMTKLVPREQFFAGHHKVLDGIFARDPQVRLAVLPADTEVVLGWLVREGAVVHYVYVKPAFRRYGIARALLGDEPWTTYTHHTYPLREISLAGKVFDPYAA